MAQAHNEVLLRNDPTAHAEILAIRKASEKLGRFHLQGCVLYTTGEPCPMCFSAIHWAHLDGVYYCNTKADAARVGFDDTLITEIIRGKRDDPIPFRHCEFSKCKKILRLWIDKTDKVIY